MKIQEVKNRIQKVVEEHKTELTNSIKSASFRYEDWKSIDEQINEILAALNAMELVEIMLKDESKTETE